MSENIFKGVCGVCFQVLKTDFVKLWNFKPDTDFSTRLFPLRLFSIHLEQLSYLKHGRKIFLQNTTTLISSHLQVVMFYN
jgi:hypothetical protein